MENQARSITVGSCTPWGNADVVDIKDNGIVSVCTPSHGGFYVPPHLNEKIPAKWRAASFNQQGERGWYEEDCDWILVAMTFPEIFEEDDTLMARSIFDRWYEPLKISDLQP